MRPANRIFIMGVALLLLLNLGLLAAVLSVRGGVLGAPVPPGPEAAPETPAVDAPAVEVPAVEVPPTPTIGLLPTAVPPPTTTSAAPLEPTSTPRATATPGPETLIHVVKEGELLSGIAAEYGVTVEDVVEANGIEDPNFLEVGQELIIPLP